MKRCKEPAAQARRVVTEAVAAAEGVLAMGGGLN